MLDEKKKKVEKKKKTGGARKKTMAKAKKKSVLSEKKRSVKKKTGAKSRDSDSGAFKKKTRKSVAAKKTIRNSSQQKSELLRSIIDHTDVMIAYLDNNFNFVWVNPAYAQTCGYDPHDMAGLNHFALYPHAENEAIFRQVRDSGEPVFFKDRPFTFPDQPERGTTYWDWSLVPVKDEQGEVANLVFSLRETTFFKKIEIDLFESEERFRAIAETSIDIIFQIDLSGKIDFVSHAVQTLGFSPADVQGRPFEEFVMPEDLPKAEEAFRKLLSGRKINLFELRLFRADGMTVNCEINASPIVRQKTVVGIQGIARDITERKIAEEKIRQIVRFPAQNPFPVLRINMDGLILYANNAAAPLLKTWGCDLQEVIPGEIRRIIDEAFATNNIMEIEQACNDRILALYVVPIIDDNFVNIYGLDITTRKQAEEEIRKNEVKLQTTLNNLTEGVIVSDLEGNLIFWNQAAVTLHGFTSEEEYLRSLKDFRDTYELLTTDDGILPFEKWPMARILRGEDLKDWEVTIRRRDINWERIYNYGGTLARDSDGRPLLGIITLSDITERKETERKIRLTNILLTGINLIFKAGMQCESEEELGQETLSVLEQVTSSVVGFIGEIGPHGKLRPIASSNKGWEEWSIQDGTGHHQPPENLKLANLFGEVLQEDKPFFVNDPAASQAGSYLPRGDTSLSAFLGIPLVYGDKTIGMIALGKRDTIFRQEDIETVQALAPAFIETLFKFRIEKALLESEVRERENAGLLKQFLDFAPIPIWIAHDPECRKITGNLAASMLSGLEPGANVSQTPGDDEIKVHVAHMRGGREISPDEMPLQYAVKNRIKVENVELDLIRPDGRVIHVVGAATPLFDENGKVSGGIAAYLDITGRKKMEDQLLKAKQEWELTFDAVPDLLAVLDTEHRIVRANRSMAKRLGMEPEELVGSPCYTFCHGTSGPIADCPHSRTLDDGREHRSELLEERLGGYYLVTTTPLKDKDGVFSRSIHVARDITVQKKAEEEIKNLNVELQKSLEQLAQLNENLQRSNVDLQHFASIVSHDLQEPLRTISSFVQLLDRRYSDAFDEKGQSFMQHVVDGTNHMQRLLNDLLSYSRVGGGKLTLQRVLLENIVADIKHRLDKRIKESRAEIAFGSLPVVYGDQMQLFTLLQNLISNGLKYRSPDRPPRISITSRQEDEYECTVCVRDNGIGIDPQHIERIFLIFQRLHLRNEYEGTGIGLAICKKIVERHGGRIWAESEPGNGSSFYFTLPLFRKNNDKYGE